MNQITPDILDREAVAGGADDVPPGSLHAQLFARLDCSIAHMWAQAQAGEFWGHVVSRGCDAELYRITMIQIYHYTRHNSINQAVAALRAEPEQLALLRFVYEHAKEELGHDRLVVHDLKSIGLWRDGEACAPPLPATEALINYLYAVALREGPIARLGYSYWAESVYGHIGPLLVAARRALTLGDGNMTFFTAHTEVDSRHAEQVRTAIRRAATTPQQAEAIHRVAMTSLWLTTQILAQAFQAWSAQGVVS